MSFDEFLKLKDPAQQLRILILKNAWRLKAFEEQPRASTKFINHCKSDDGVRLAELLNPIPESL